MQHTPQNGRSEGWGHHDSVGVSAPGSKSRPFPSLPLGVALKAAVRPKGGKMRMLEVGTVGPTGEAVTTLQVN